MQFKYLSEVGGTAHSEETLDNSSIILRHHNKDRKARGWNKNFC